MTRDNEHLKNIDIGGYIDKILDMITPLLPNSKRWLNYNQYLQDTLLELNVVADGLYQWRKFLLMAQTQEQVTPQAFEKAYIRICWDGLLDWAERRMNLLELHTLLTNQKANRIHLSNLAKRYRRGGYPLTRQLDPKTSQVVIVFEDNEDEEEPEDLTILTTKQALLKENIKLTTQNLKAVLWWRDVIIEWHYHKTISQEVFEDAFITFCRVGLLDIDWVNVGLDEIYKVVTGQDVDNERLNAIEDLFRIYD